MKDYKPMRSRKKKKKPGALSVGFGFFEGDDYIPNPENKQYLIFDDEIHFLDDSERVAGSESDPDEPEDST